MDLLSTLLGVSLASGLNVYATVLAMGVLHRLGVFHLPPALDVVSSTPILVAATVLYVVEFVVDKVPFLDSAWDTLHTLIRPAVGAFMATVWWDTLILNGSFLRPCSEEALHSLRMPQRHQHVPSLMSVPNRSATGS